MAPFRAAKMRRFKVDPKREVRAPEARPGRAGAILHGSKADQVCLLSGNPFGNGGVSFCKSTPDWNFGIPRATPSKRTFQKQDALLALATLGTWNP